MPDTPPTSQRRSLSRLTSAATSRTGSRSQYTETKPTGLSMNRTASRSAEFIPQAAFRRTEVRAPVVVAARFMVPMHQRKRKGAFHEPLVWSSGFSRSERPEGGTPNKLRRTARSMVPMHGIRAEGALREPGSPNVSPASWTCYCSCPNPCAIRERGLSMDPRHLARSGIQEKRRRRDLGSA